MSSMVFWRKGNRAPQLDLCPASWCAKCEKRVEARQTYKNGRRIGKYKQQYVYTCPTCFGEVSPYYFAAFNAIDFSIPAERIGDRARPLRHRTIERIKYGLEKFSNIGLVIRTNIDALVSPLSFIAETNWSGESFHPPRSIDLPLPTQSTRQSSALVIMPPLGIVPQRTNNVSRDLAEPLNSFCTGNHHMLISGCALVSLQSNENIARLVDIALPTQLANGPHHGIVQRSPFLVSYYGSGRGAEGIAKPIRVITTLERHALALPEKSLRVEDYYFRMLQPPEIKSGMAFPSTYVVLGNKREMVKQLGNAVTPPVMGWLVKQCVESLR